MTGQSIEDLERRFGTQVRQLRQSRSLSQVELARRSNVSRSAIVSLEAGAGSSLVTLIKVLDALDRSDWLLTLEAPPDAFNPLDLLDRTARPGASRRWVTPPRTPPRTPRRPQ